MHYDTPVQLGDADGMCGYSTGLGELGAGMKGVKTAKALPTKNKLAQQIKAISADDRAGIKAMDLKTKTSIMKDLVKENTKIAQKAGVKAAKGAQGQQKQFKARLARASTSAAGVKELDQFQKDIGVPKKTSGISSAIKSVGKVAGGLAPLALTALAPMAGGALASTALGKTIAGKALVNAIAPTPSLARIATPGIAAPVAALTQAGGGSSNILGNILGSVVGGTGSGADGPGGLLTSVLSNAGGGSWIQRTLRRNQNTIGGIANQIFGGGGGGDPQPVAQPIAQPTPSYDPTANVSTPPPASPFSNPIVLVGLGLAAVLLMQGRGKR